jgi:pyridoxal phosphate enzyme (YggS family)
MSVAQNYGRVKEKIAELALACNRDPTEIEIVAVSKGYTWQHLQPAYQKGCRNFGESRWQESVEKIETAPKDINWHFIGPLQKNKVRKVIASFDLIHSVDSLELAEKISEVAQELDKTVSILLEVNTSGEAAKHGFAPNELEKTFDGIRNLSHLRLEGLMTMASLGADEKTIRNCFATLRKLRKGFLQKEDPSFMHHLSMGMSQDYPWAVEEGATLLRIGTAIFG